MRTIPILIFLNIVTLHALTDEQISKEWEEFQRKYHKSYKSTVEIRKRFSIFKDNLQKYNAHNALYDEGKVSYKKGINQFSHWTNDEFMIYVNKGLLHKPVLRQKRLLFTDNGNISLPTSIDWRNQGAVTAIKDQGSCGSCWAFSTTGALEGHLKIATGKLVSLSEQNLIDCSWVQGNDGCDGGLVDNALDFVKEFGIESEADYPYLGKNGNCHHNERKIVTMIRGYVDIREGSEKQLQQAIATFGPVSVAIDATFELQGYQSGILDDEFCTTYELNHGVVVVGFGIENGLEYYIVKNSWGEDWGENGFFRIVRNKNNRCGIATMASYPQM